VIARAVGRFLALCLVALPVASCTSVTTSTQEVTAPWTSDRVEALPSPGNLEDVTLAQALAKRRSVREFAPDPITGEQEAALMWAAQGQTAEWGGRTAPSAGALYALEVYLVTAEGIWHYVPDGHRGQWRETTAAGASVAEGVGQDAARSAPAVMVITGSPDRLRPTYGDRAERYTYLEAGHSAQNVLLAATALGLGAVPIGAFDQEAVAAALGLPDAEVPIYAIPVGVPENVASEMQ